MSNGEYCGGGEDVDEDVDDPVSEGDSQPGWRWRQERTRELRTAAGKSTVYKSSRLPTRTRSSPIVSFNSLSLQFPDF